MGHVASFEGYVILIKKDEEEGDTLCDVSNDIYCHDCDCDEDDDEDCDCEDNSIEDQFIITQKFINSLSPGDKLVLRMNGDGANC